MEKKIYLAIRENKAPWSEQKQYELGHIPWSEAVNIAKSQAVPTRLSESKGYNNQGHYFYPEAFLIFNPDGE